MKFIERGCYIPTAQIVIASSTAFEGLAPGEGPKELSLHLAVSIVPSEQECEEQEVHAGELLTIGGSVMNYVPHQN